MVTWILLLLVSTSFCKVYVYEPSELRNKLHEDNKNRYDIPSSLANFGNPQYGSVITGGVFRPKAGQELACSRLDHINFIEGDPDRAITPILLVDRGGCSFVVKVRNAQTIGAAAVIIIDNRAGEDVERIIMVDDGTAGNIQIPSFLISKESGATILDYVYDDPNETETRASLTLTFEIPHPDNRVEYDIWMSSGQKHTREFLAQFSSEAMRFDEDTAKMTPHYRTHQCLECKEGNFTTYNDPDCISGGRYCEYDPDGDGPLRGSDILQEDIRQILIYNYAEEKKDPTLWWKYVTALYKECPDKLNEDCSKTAMDEVGINKENILLKYKKSFDGEDEKNDNSIMKQQLQDLVETGVAFFPMIVINKKTFRGDIETDAVMVGICAGFLERPKTCKDYEKKTHKEPKSSTSIGTLAIVLIVVFVVLMIAAVLILYRLWLRNDLSKDMKLQVNSAVSQYIALSESNH